MSFYRLSSLALLFVLGTSACIQTENSSTLDAATYGDIGGSAAFTASRKIMSQSCANCHSYHTMTETALIAAGLVIAGQPDNSKIYYRLAGSAGTSGPKNMPTGGALSTSEVTTIRTWIQNIQ